MEKIKELEKKLRTEIMEKILAKVELPKFLEEEISITLEYLNYYKLKRLKERLDLYIEKLQKIVDNYYQTI